MTDQEIRDDIRRAQAGDSEAMERLILANEGLVRSVVKKVVRPPAPASLGWSGLRQEGRLAFARAVMDYDPTGRAKLSTVAVHYIRNAVIAALRDSKPMRPKEPKAGQLPLVVGIEAIRSRPFSRPNSEPHRKIDFDLEQLLSIAGKHGSLLVEHYLAGMTWEEIGCRRGITKAAAVRRAQMARQEIRKRFEL